MILCGLEVRVDERGAAIEVAGCRRDGRLEMGKGGQQGLLPLLARSLGPLAPGRSEERAPAGSELGLALSLGSGRLVGRSKAADEEDDGNCEEATHGPFSGMGVWAFAPQCRPIPLPV